MALFAEGAGFWDWAVKFMDPQTLTQVGIIVGLVLKHFRDEHNKKEVKKEVTDGNELTKENKKAIEQVLPGVTVKVDSAEKKADEATSEAKKLIVTAAEKIGTAIAEKMDKKADENAEKVAEKVAEVAVEAKEDREKLVGTVNRIANAIHGPGERDGEGETCLTAKVREHGDAIKELKNEMAGVKKDVAEGLGILREMQESRR